MKTFIQTLFFLSLFLITAFPQNRIHKGVLPEILTTDNFRDIHKPNVGGLQGFNNIESLLLKSKCNNWQTALRNQHREFYQEEGFDTKDTRTNINKTLLGNGFLLIEAIYQTWNVTAWVNSWKFSFTYDGNNNLTEELDQYWAGTAWVKGWKYSYTYDGNNNLTESLSQTWNGTAWVNSSKDLFTYDGNNNLTESLSQTWNGTAWVNSFKYSYTYDGNNNLTEELDQTWDGSAWVNSFKYSYTYDGNNNLTEELDQTWDGSAWVNSGKYSGTYDGNNNLTELLYQTWDGTAWVNSFKYSYTYDGNNNLTEELDQTWDGSVWVNSGKYSGTYDGNNNFTELLYQTWDGTAWVNSFKYSYTYVPVTAVNEDLSSVNYYTLSNNYPNPFNPSTKIKYRVLASGQLKLSVYNLVGEEVAVLVNDFMGAGLYEVSFNAANLPSGTYFYRLQADGFVETKKMLLLK